MLKKISIGKVDNPRNIFYWKNIIIHIKNSIDMNILEYYSSDVDAK